MRLGLVSVFLLGKTVRLVVHRLHLFFHMLDCMLLVRIFLSHMLLLVLLQLVLHVNSMSRLSHAGEVMRTKVGRVALSCRKPISQALLEIFLDQFGPFRVILCPASQLLCSLALCFSFLSVFLFLSRVHRIKVGLGVPVINGIC